PYVIDDDDEPGIINKSVRLNARVLDLVPIAGQRTSLRFDGNRLITPLAFGIEFDVSTIECLNRCPLVFDQQS
ncbi:MAG TPA: hypothetical protein VNO24_27570, partial [Blastocatellia bacterium]|nr:hypothetical protein [Blastocatellia bacterium]